MFSKGWSFQDLCVCVCQANDYTVAVDQVEGLDSSIDSMGLTLLSTLRATDRFQTLRTSK